MPDRLALFPDGKCGFVEVKAPGEKSSPLQGSRMAMLRKMEIQAFVLDRTEQIGGIIDEIRGA